MNGVILSVILIFNYADGGQSIEQFKYQFKGPTAIEYCQNAKDRINSAVSGGIAEMHAECYPRKL
jgi:hypothetical protein